MPSRVATWLAIASACACAAPGCASPTAQPEAPDAQPAHGELVHATIAGPFTGTSATIAVPPTATDDVVVVTLHRPADYGVAKRILVGDVELEPWLRAVSECGSSTEAWSSGIFGEIHGGASSVAVELSDPDTFSVGVLEFAGVSGPHSSGAGRIEGMTPGSAPRLHADPGEVVLSTITTCGVVTSLAAPSSFTSFALDAEHTSVAYAVATTPDDYGATWSYDGAPWDGMTIVFR